MACTSETLHCSSRRPAGSAVATDIEPNIRRKHAHQQLLKTASRHCHRHQRLFAATPTQDLHNRGCSSQNMTNSRDYQKTCNYNFHISNNTDQCSSSCDHHFHSRQTYKSRTIRWLLLKASFYLTIFAFLSSNSVLSMEVPWQYQVDLINGLSLRNSSYGGVRVIPGPDYSIPAIQLSGNRRRLQLPEKVYKKTAKILSSSKDFAIMANVRQEKRNSGTIVSISSGTTRFLELQSSGRKNEIRLHYTSSAVNEDGSRRVFIETFPYKLADNEWHKVAVTISGDQIELWINCSRIYSRVTGRQIDHRLINDDQEYLTSGQLQQTNNYSLWLGQRNEDPHFIFQGALQDVKIVAHAHGHLLQCPQLDADCPTCGQFQQLQESMQKMENFVKELASKLSEAQQRISELEKCECSVSCKFNGTVIRDGATWQESCELCSCVRGEVVCRPMNCPAVYCKNPVTLPGECCPKCLRTCYIQQRRYEHGEEFSIPSNPCTRCTCQNGFLKCMPRDKKKVCPKLACPEFVQVQPDGECCKTCPDCSYGHDCHVNATCVSLNTRYKCLCKGGFTGSGKQCTDIDECENKGGRTGNHCQRNTKCVNTPGSYECACLPGYTRKDAYNCIDENECLSEAHTCLENTVCVNDEGSYHCECATGYKGNGVDCQPVCDPPCSSGGQCVAPNTCSCHPGYIGSSCDIDVDECSNNLHHCDNNSICVNMPGWYYCECRKGYQRKIQRNSLVAQCQDIDECLEDSHTCLSPSYCVNTLGGYRCQCPNQRHRSCSVGCFYEGKERKNGESWQDQNDPCKQCQCRDGIVNCMKMNCNCNHMMRNSSIAAHMSTCCPHCDRASQCKHQETPQLFKNGQQWMYQCQLCECLHGEVDCWDMKCPPLSCENPVYVDGLCCPTCPEVETCNATSNSSLASSNCMYNGVLYRHGEQMRQESDPCTNCKCKIPYCDLLVSNMAINIHRMENCIALSILIVIIGLVLEDDLHDILQNVQLLVFCLKLHGISMFCAVLILFRQSILTLVKSTASNSLVSKIRMNVLSAKLELKKYAGFYRDEKFGCQ